MDWRIRRRERMLEREKDSGGRPFLSDHLRASFPRPPLSSASFPSPFPVVPSYHYVSNLAASVFSSQSNFPRNSYSNHVASNFSNLSHPAQPMSFRPALTPLEQGRHPNHSDDAHQLPSNLRNTQLSLCWPVEPYDVVPTGPSSSYDHIRPTSSVLNPSPQGAPAPTSSWNYSFPFPSSYSDRHQERAFEGGLSPEVAQIVRQYLPFNPASSSVSDLSPPIQHNSSFVKHPPLPPLLSPPDNRSFQQYTTHNNFQRIVPSNFPSHPTLVPPVSAPPICPPVLPPSRPVLSAPQPNSALLPTPIRPLIPSFTSENGNGLPDKRTEASAGGNALSSNKKSKNVSRKYIARRVFLNIERKSFSMEWAASPGVFVIKEDGTRENFS